MKTVKNFVLGFVFISFGLLFGFAAGGSSYEGLVPAVYRKFKRG